MELKVCGLTKTEEVQFCVDNDVNYCGFILNYPKSHRFITLEKAQALTNIQKKILIIFNYMEITIDKILLKLKKNSAKK